MLEIHLFRQATKVAYPACKEEPLWKPIISQTSMTDRSHPSAGLSFISQSKKNFPQMSQVWRKGENRRFECDNQTNRTRLQSKPRRTLFAPDKNSPVTNKLLPCGGFPSVAGNVCPGLYLKSSLICCCRADDTSHTFLSL